MNILHINSYFASSKFYSLLYRQQLEQGMEIRVFMPYEKGRKLSLDAYPAYCQQAPCYHRLDRAFFPLKTQKIWNACLKEYGALEGFDIVHAHSLFTNGVIANRIFQKYGIPYIVAVRDTDINIFFKKMLHLRNLGRRILHDAAQVIFLSPAYQKEALVPYLSPQELEEVKKKSAVLPNGIDGFWFSHRAKEPRAAAPSKGVRILFVGELTKRKNLKTLLAACQLLLDEGVALTLTVVGRQVDPKEYQRLAGKTYVTYQPPCSFDELIQFYRQADLFVLPSWTETFGLVYAEALSQGLPVIYSQGQGFDGQFPDGEVGFAVQAGDARDVVRGIRAALAQHSALSAQCVRQVDRFSWPAIARGYLELYAQIAGS